MTICGRCGVVGSALAFGFKGHGSIRAPLIFTSYGISLHQAEITDVVLIGRLSSLPAHVAHSASYQPGKTNRV